MRISEYFKKQREQFKSLPKEERWSYFWDYYKWHTLAVVLVIVLLIQGVAGIINRKQIVISGILLNCMISYEDDAFLQGFYDHAGFDGKNQEAAFYTDLILTDNNSKTDITAFQRIIAGIATKDTDFVVGQTANFRLCAYSTSRMFMDLRELLDEATLEKLAGKIYYIDGDVVKQIAAPVGEELNTNVDYPDPFKPEAMKDPIPVGIDVSKCEAFQSAYYFPNTKLYLGIATTTPRQDTARQFIDYLFS